MSRVDYVYLIVDASNSMRGSKIGTVNDAINNILFRLRKIGISNNIDIKMILMTYADNVVWSNIFPVTLDTFKFNDLTVIGNRSNLSEAYKELKEKLNKQSASKSFQDNATTIILFTDGLATDLFEDELKELKKNKVFASSNRIGVTFNDDLSKEFALQVLAGFVSAQSNVVVDDFNLLNRLLFEKYKR